MSGNKPSSIIVDSIPNGWGIRGFTKPIQQDLIDCGATWNAKAVRWEVMGTKLPDCVKRAISGLSKLKSSEKPQKVEIVQKTAEIKAIPTVVEHWDKSILDIPIYVIRFLSKVRADLFNMGDKDTVVKTAWLRDVVSAKWFLANPERYMDALNAMARWESTPPFEPDGTSPYMIENQRKLSIGQDWLGWVTCYQCGGFLDFAANRGASAPAGSAVPLIGNGSQNFCDECWTDMYHLEHVVVDEPKPKTAKPAFGKAAKVTPLRQQYLELKAQCPDCILFFRLGDFYETFDGDAEIAAKVCDLVLTSRPISKTERVPMAGVPYHTLDQFIPKLIAAGHSVAVAEQASEPDGRGIVDRSVTRVIRPQAKDEAKPDGVTKTITVKTRDGDRNTNAELFGQLAVHHTLALNSGLLDTWNVTHIKSGMALGGPIEDRDEAVNLAKSLQELDFDAWWESGCKDTAFADQARAIRERVVKGKAVQA